MTAKIKNIIIFTAIGAVLILVYIFFIKKSPEQPALISTFSGEAEPSADTSSQSSSITKDFLTLLLNVKNIKLDNTIFSDVAFSNLRDSSIVLIPDGTEGRPNPFAPFGSDVIVLPINTPTSPVTP
ncbi:hypothetical protein A2814_02100 [Candidatus Nomurabacteria bacterium RIFCSPHIGHO2_01_FULL_38_19]|uniref:Uncharacterized protein n=1 Tax=Candidatus Nomurabacteria bacterium RIFCSPHIGHO2_01_FULL_38_19 TaxID=1801732 RepID=A0A1F6UUU9_9BACT|nr:MAG: hypothetical protein A2814_02100 [Candidatus Nomurabacteria bacterium RIFCSPHIGHO2_01_FULL_38_19]